MNRGLDGIYFRVERNGKWQSICMSDLTEEEFDKVMENKNRNFAVSCCKILVLEPGGIDHPESTRNNQSELIRKSQCTYMAN